MSTPTSKTLSVEQVQKLQRSVAEMGDQHGVVVAAWLIRGMCEEILYARNGIPHAHETGECLWLQEPGYNAKWIPNCGAAPFYLNSGLELYDFCPGCGKRISTSEKASV